MASSGYWYNLYKAKRDLVKTYEGQIKELRTILSNLQDNLWDEIRAVNNKIDDLKDDLNKGIRHNSRFTSKANALGTEKEKAVTADTSLRVSVNEVDGEIARLSSLKGTAERERDDYYSKYTTAKEEERQERLKALGL